MVSNDWWPVRCDDGEHEWGTGPRCARCNLRRGAAGTPEPSQAATEAHGNRRGPSGHLCCKHCVEDEIHDAETDAHDGPCGTCDDPVALLRERLAVAESAVARVKAFHFQDGDRCRGDGCAWPCPTIFELMEPE